MPMLKLSIAFLCSLALVGCSSAGPEGVLLADGRISPCPNRLTRFHTDPQACGNAIFNARVIGQVAPGQTKDQVREIMKHDPERREIQGTEELWSYITDYDAELMTTIVFTNGVVTGMKQQPWKSED